MTRTLRRAATVAAPSAPGRCSGAMAEGHDPHGATTPHRIGTGTARRTVHLCQPCEDAAARLGVIADRRATIRA